MVAGCDPAPQSTNTKSQGRRRSRCSSSMRRAGSGCEPARLPCVAAIRPRFATRVSITRSSGSCTRPDMKSARLARGEVTPSQVWRFAPSTSVSTATTRAPARASEAARFAARKVLPTPPLPPPTTIRRGAPSGLSASVARSLPSPLFGELHVPVGGIDHAQEGTPLLVANARPHQVGERRPARPLGTVPQLHVRLPRRAPALLAIAVDAARHDVLPRAAPAERARNHVIEVQLRAVWLRAAVLAREVVARHQVDAAEAHAALRQPLEGDQHDHAGDANQAARRPDRLP